MRFLWPSINQVQAQTTSTSHCFLIIITIVITIITIVITIITIIIRSAIFKPRHCDPFSIRLNKSAVSRYQMAATEIYITSYESPPSLTKIMKIFWKKWKNCHVILHCVVLNGRVWYFMVLGCIDTVDVILSWVTGPGAGMTESIKWVPAPNALTMLTDLNQKSWLGGSPNLGHQSDCQS